MVGIPSVPRGSAWIFETEQRVSMEKAKKCCSDAERWKQDEEEAKLQNNFEPFFFKIAQKGIVQARQAPVG